MTSERMISLSETRNFPLIQQIVTNPAIYPFVSDDGSPAPEYWKAPEAFKYCLVTDEDEVLGVWIFRQCNAVTWEVHTCLLPNARGKRAYQALKMLPEWAWDNLKGAKRVTTEVPVNNGPALVFALRAGMERFGINKKSYLKGGELLDVILLGISRGEPCQ